MTRALLAHSCAIAVSVATLYGGMPSTSVPFEIGDLQSLRVFGRDLRVSPDGLWLAVTVCDPPTSAPGITPGGRVHHFRGCAVHVVNRSSGDILALGDGRDSSLAPSWSPDGQELAFISDRDGEPQAWLWNRSSRRMRLASPAVLVTFDAKRTGVPAWSPNGKFLLVKIPSSDAPRAEPGDDIVSIAQKQTADASTVAVYRSPDPGTPHKGERAAIYSGDLALISVASGTTTRLSRDTNAIWARFSPDGSMLLYQNLVGHESSTPAYEAILVSVPSGHELARLRHETPGTATMSSWAPSGSVFTFAPCRFGMLRSSAPPVQVLLPLTSSECGAAWHPTDDVLFFLSNSEQSPLSPAAELYTLDPLNGERRLLGRIDGIRPQLILTAAHDRVSLSLDGRNVRAFALDPDTRDILLYEFGLDGRSSRRLKRISQWWGRAQDLAARDLSIQDDTFVYVAEDSSQPSDVWSLRLSDESAPTRVTNINSHVAQLRFGHTTLIRWHSALDGRALHGTLVLPPDHSPGTRHPLVVMVYGSDYLSIDRHSFGGGYSGWNAHLFATRGYAVLLPDSYVVEGQPMKAIAAAVLPGVDAAVAQGYAEPEHIGVLGRSYGAYSVLALLVQTGRFKAAVAASGLYDLWRLYGTLEPSGNSPFVRYAEQGQASMGVPPWTDRWRYISNSPLFEADRVTTPLLLIHGGLDAVPVSQADALFVSLRRLGRPVEYVRYNQGRHTLARSQFEGDVLERILRWLSRYVGRQSPAGPVGLY